MDGRLDLKEKKLDFFNRFEWNSNDRNFGKTGNKTPEFRRE